MSSKIKTIILVCIALATVQCEKDKPDPNADFFPPIQVYTTINLAFPQFADLGLIQGYAYLPEGNKGIVVFHTIDDRYVAFDRTCSHNPSAACSQIVMDSSRTFYRCGKYNPAFEKCCDSRFDASSGVVQNGPASLPLKQYFTAVQGNTIVISSNPF